jgi:hypothetical protein
MSLKGKKKKKKALFNYIYAGQFISLVGLVARFLLMDKQVQARHIQWKVI